MPRGFIKFLVPGHHGRSIHPEYFVFFVALSARIKTTKRINQMAMDGYGLYFGAKSNQSLAVDVDYGTCLILFMNRWYEGMYGERWKKFRRIILLRLCKIYMNNKGYHPVFESNPTCGLHYALKLKNEGQFQKAEQILRKIKDDDEFNLFETIEKNAVYRNILHLGLYRINRKVGGLKDKMNDYQKIVNKVLPGIYIDRKCQRVLMNELLEIEKQIPVKFTGHFNKDKLEKCNKRTD